VQDFEGGPDEFVKALRLSGNPKVAELARRYSQLPVTGRANFSFQSACKSLQIEPHDVLADMVVNLYHYHGSLARIVNSVSVTKVMRASVDAALTPGGVDDRRMQLDIAGLLPRKGPLVKVDINEQNWSPEKTINEMDAINVSPDDNPKPDPTS
jgi:hypothetical protein